MSKFSETSIAIVGAACRLPGAPNLGAFWEVLHNGRDVVTEVPEDRWAKSFYFHPDPGQPGKSYTWSAGVLPDVCGFDADFFGISPREAEQIDPQQRLILELAWEAFEDAGIPPSKLAGSACGVYIGFSGAEYANARMGDPSSADAYFMTGTTGSIVANRVSYVFDLRGPSFIVDTACSSSLVALHQACEAIRRGEVESALVGGVNLLLSPYPFIGFCRASMLSPTGRCFAFDARANGYVRAEGGGMIFLKPLNRALENGDQIRGIVAATGVNSDGRTSGISLPNQHAQAALLRDVYSRAAIRPEELSFMEAHGTGTAAGDPIEIAAIGEVLGANRTIPLPVGSVKTNVGHLETASGMAGLLKSMLAIEHRQLPRSLHFERPNPRIRFDELNVEVAAEARVLPNGGARLLAGVNSFGFGGTNAHAILESAPQVNAKATSRANLQPKDLHPPLLVSARSEAALAQLACEWRQTLSAHTSETTDQLIRGAARRRDHFRHRMAVWGNSPDDLRRALERESADRRVRDVAVGDDRAVFVFSGNGSQWLGMAQDALEHSAPFRAGVEAADAVLASQLGWSVLDALSQPETSALASTKVAQPLLFAVQVGIVKALEFCGVTPDVCIGHSVGEIAAAWTSGRLSLVDACRVVVVRSAEQERTRGNGRMAALGISPDLARKVVSRMGGGLELAAINSSASVTLAGSREDIAALGREAETEGWRFSALDLDYAFHSSAMDCVREGVLAELSDLTPRSRGGLLVSTVTGKAVDADALGADYWWRNVRDPVQFGPGVDYLVRCGYRIFVEIGPAPILQSYIREQFHAAGAEGRALPTLRREKADADPFQSMAVSIYAAGYDLAKSQVFDGQNRWREIPRYPWQRERFWTSQTQEAVRLNRPVPGKGLLGFGWEQGSRVWKGVMDASRDSWLLDHAFEGVPILPAAAMTEMAISVGWNELGEAPEIVDLDFHRPMAFEIGRSREVRVRLGEEGRIWIESRVRLSDEDWIIHAAARMRVCAAGPPALTMIDIGARLGAADVYQRAEAMGLEYGPVFRTVQQIRVAKSDDEAIVSLSAGAVAPLLEGCALQPPLLDGAFQGLLGILSLTDLPPNTSFLPSRVGRTRMYGEPGQTPVQARLKITHRGVRTVCADIDLFDKSGSAVASLQDCWFSATQRRRSVVVEDRTYRFIARHASRHVRAPEQLVKATQAAFAATPSELAQSPGESALLLDAYLAASALKIVSQLVEPAVSFDVRDLVDIGKVAPDSALLFVRTLEFLRGFGLAERLHGQCYALSSDALGEPDTIWRTLLAEHCDLVGDLALAAQAVARLPDMLRTPLCDQQAQADLELLLASSATLKSSAAALAARVAKLIRAVDPERPLRVLEFGAGDGDFLRVLAAELGDWPETLSYVVADEKANQAARLRSTLSNRPSIEVVTWSIASAEEPSGSLFDIIVASHGTFGRSDPQDALSRLSPLLAEGGIFLAAEPEPNFLFDVMLCALPHGRQESLDPDVPSSPLCDATRWLDLGRHAHLSPIGAKPVEGSLWPVSLLAFIRSEPQEGSSVSLPGFALVSAGDLDFDRRLEAAALEVGVSTKHVSLRSTGDEELIPEGMDVVIGPAVMETSEATECATYLADIARVARRLSENPRRPQLWVITRGALHGSANFDTACRSGAALGLMRTLSNETPQLSVRLLDLHDDLTPGPAALAVLDEICGRPDEREILLTPTGRRAVRLDAGWGTPKSIDGAKHLQVARPGLLDSLQWETVGGQPPPMRGEIAVEVRAAGLNFRDVMWAQGLLPEEALKDGFAGPTFGLECAGVVTEVGKGVDALPVGAPVLAFAPSSLSTRVVTKASAVTRISADLSFRAAATIPVAFLTAIYALGRIGRLATGERVLIHGGAGGVGLAAIQYAKHRGATVFATAGSELKRCFLRSFGADYVLDSRSLDFASQIDGLTRGEGVDVVLNSLSGEAMQRSLELLRPFGRFLELGKRDFYFGSRVGLRSFRQNISYFAIDADQLPQRRPDMCAEIIGEVMNLLDQGILSPLPTTAFGMDEVVDAFRLMQGSRHIGKVVVTMDDAPRASDRANNRAFVVRPDSTYLVVGGLTGFGLETAHWLVDQGARHLAFLSRRGSSSADASDVVRVLEAKGAQVYLGACDASDREALENALADIRRNMPPLRGVINAAMVVEDGLVLDLDGEKLQRVLAPKMYAALNLDRLTRNDPIELFILYSSATTVLGAPGQGAYVAANAAMEALARGRAEQGLPALAVGWGPIADAGFLARDEASLGALARRLGAAPMLAREALEALPQLWRSGEPVLAYAAMDWANVRHVLPILKGPAYRRFSDGVGGGPEGNICERLADLGVDEAIELIVEVLAQELAQILGSSAEAIDPHRPLVEYGVDSLMAVELRLAIEGRLGLAAPLMSIGEGTSVATLAGRLARMMKGERESSAAIAETASIYEGVLDDGEIDKARVSDEILLGAAE